MKTEVDISRVLGKDAKDALNFGNVGILTYNEEYIVTWASPFFKEKGITLTNSNHEKKRCSNFICEGYYRLL